jgi:ribulose-5-phosphate 4-epimerase/fuculose-1-phosphate aldolase
MSRELYRQGIITPMGGNLSVRPDGRAMVLITPSGLHKGRLRAADMVLAGFDGGVAVLSALPGHVPSVETGVHVAVYRARPDVTAVVHGHPPHATALVTDGVPIEPVTVEGIRFARVPRVGPYPPGSAALAEAVAAALTGNDAVLLEGHGAFTAAGTLHAAADLMIELEHACRVQLLMRGTERGR